MGRIVLLGLSDRQTTKAGFLPFAGGVGQLGRGGDRHRGIALGVSTLRNRAESSIERLRSD